MSKEIDPEQMLRLLVCHHWINTDMPTLKTWLVERTREHMKGEHKMHAVMGNSRCWLSSEFVVRRLAEYIGEREREREET